MSQTQQPANMTIERISLLQKEMGADYVQLQLKSALADNSSAFAASLVDLFSTDKNLLECDPKRVIMQAMKAAVLKMPINKSLGFGFIVAYKGIPEFQIGYKGLIQLALRTGQYRIINADVVYEGEYKTKNKLTGEFDLTGEAKSDKIIGYFAHIEMNNGFSKTLFMTREKVDAHAKKYSKSYSFDSSPWKKEFDAMAIKTVLRNLLTHYGYLSIDVANVLDKEDAADTVENEINNNGNKKDMSFNNIPEAELVKDNNQNTDETKPPF